ncbi:exonuclease domain-containing protein [Streptomyces sp. NPDC020983]|uniref:3'-5' exonuclease n=1 Tax=Streptomyces sp. NPDC020983 TaxID=3365106 RepID=UPI0037B4C41F
MPPVEVLAASGGGFAVVDVEATGSSSRRHRVVEVGVVLLGPGLAPEGEFSTLVDPLGPVGPTHIHGIEPSHLSGAPRFAGIAGRLLALLRGRVLVGHNVGCDRAFLAAEYARIGVRLPAVPELCTMRMAAERAERAEGDTYGLSLRACARALGLGGEVAHTALGDARTAAALFGHFVAERGAVGGGPAAVALAERLSQAAEVRWPEAGGLPHTADALWKRRSNVSAGQYVPNVRHGSA